MDYILTKSEFNKIKKIWKGYYSNNEHCREYSIFQYLSKIFRNKNDKTRKLLMQDHILYCILKGVDLTKCCPVIRKDTYDILNNIRITLGLMFEKNIEFRKESFGYRIVDDFFKIFEDCLTTEHKIKIYFRLEEFLDSISNKYYKII